MSFQVYFPQPYQIGRSPFNDLPMISQEVIRRAGHIVSLWISEGEIRRAEPIDDPGVSEEVIQRAEEVFRNGTFKTASPEERRAVYLAADRLYGQMDPIEYKNRASQWFLFISSR